MPEPTVVTTPAEEKKTPTLIEEVRGKTFDQIIREQAQARQQAASGEEGTQETDEEKKKKEEEEKKKAEEEEAKKKQEAEEAQKKHDEEVAATAAAEVLAKQEEEKKAAEDKAKAEEEAKKREEALKPHYTGKDKDGNVVPKDWNEANAEAVRIAEERRLQAEQEAAAKAQQEAEQKAQQEESAKKQKEAIEKDLQTQFDTDLTAIYAAGDLPKVKDPNNEKDEGNMAFKHLLETAQKVNMDRIAKGEKPILSLQIIRYGRDAAGKPYYTPLKKEVAGANAPVLGAESSQGEESNDDKYVVARDRNKSMSQLVREEAQRLGRKILPRGR